MSSPTSVMIVEDNADYRAAVEIAVNNELDMEFIAQFQTAEVAIRSLTEDKITPDIILLDIRLPGMTGLQAIPGLLNAAPNSKIVVLSQSNQEADVIQAISAGATGYLLKSVSAPELLSAIRSVANGHATIDPGVAQYLLNRFRKPTESKTKPSVLSDREMEVLALLAEGLVKKEIATRLNIGYTTVDTHVSRIYGKLKVNNAPAAVNRAHKMNLLPPDDSTRL